jgi:hypothetical protein
VKPRPRYSWVQRTPPSELDFGEDTTRDKYLL